MNTNRQNNRGCAREVRLTAAGKIPKIIKTLLVCTASIYALMLAGLLVSFHLFNDEVPVTVEQLHSDELLRPLIPVWGEYEFGYRNLDLNLDFYRFKNHQSKTIIKKTLEENGWVLSEETEDHLCFRKSTDHLRLCFLDNSLTIDRQTAAELADLPGNRH